MTTRSKPRRAWHSPDWPALYYEVSRPNRWVLTREREPEVKDSWVLTYSTHDGHTTFEERFDSFDKARDYFKKESP